MGLSIHYCLKSASKASDRAGQLVHQMRQLALDLPFGAVSELSHLQGSQCHPDSVTDRKSRQASILRQTTVRVDLPWASKKVKVSPGCYTGYSRHVDVPPLEVFAFHVEAGPGCEYVELGLACYPAEVEVMYDPNQDARFLDNDFNFSYRKWTRHIERTAQPQLTWPMQFIPDAKKPAYTWHDGRYDPHALVAELGDWNQMIAAGAARSDGTSASMSACYISAGQWDTQKATAVRTAPFTTSTSGGPISGCCRPAR